MPILIIPGIKLAGYRSGVRIPIEVNVYFPLSVLSQSTQLAELTCGYPEHILGTVCTCPYPLTATAGEKKDALFLTNQLMRE